MRLRLLEAATLDPAAFTPTDFQASLVTICVSNGTDIITATFVILMAVCPVKQFPHCVLRGTGRGWEGWGGGQPLPPERAPTSRGTLHLGWSNPTQPPPNHVLLAPTQTHTHSKNTPSHDEQSSSGLRLLTSPAPPSVRHFKLCLLGLFFFFVLLKQGGI